MEEPAQLGAQDRMIGQPGEERLDGVEHHAFGTDGIDGEAEADEQPLQIILAGLLDLAALNADMLEHEFFLGDELVQVEAERADVGGEFRGVFFEHHEHARLAELRGPPHQKLHREHRLATTRTAANQRGPTRWQSAAGDFIKALDAGGGLGETGGSRRTGWIFFLFHNNPWVGFSNGLKHL